MLFLKCKKLRSGGAKAALCGLLCLTLLSVGCARLPAKSTGSFTVIATNFPAYDFARQLCGENASVTMLLPPGTESHSYEPTPHDILAIQNCDLFLYTGGESDVWADTLLDSFEFPVSSVRMMALCDTVEEETVSGMQGEQEENADEPEYDEHVWTSPANAMQIIRGFADALCEGDPAHADQYRAREQDSLAQLTRLDNDFRAFFETVNNRTLLFGDRFPFRYFIEEYGLSYYAAFPGCAAQTEPSASTMAFLIQKAREDDCSTVYYIEFSNHRVADAIAEAAGKQTALLHSCHNVTAEQLEQGVTYLSLMEQNLQTLKETMR